MEWYYANEREEQVPVNEEDLRNLVNTGTVRGETLIWRDGMPDWQPCRTVRPDWFAPPYGYGETPAAATPSPYLPPALPQMRGPGQTDSLALTSMILGICGVAFSFCYGFGAVIGLAAVICGHIARNRLKVQTGVSGEGMALAGLITGYIAILIGICFIGLFAFFMVAAASAPATP